MTLTSSNVAALQVVPEVVIVPAGEASATFAVTTLTVAAPDEGDAHCDARRRDEDRDARRTCGSRGRCADGRRRWLLAPRPLVRSEAAPGPMARAAPLAAGARELLLDAAAERAHSGSNRAASPSSAPSASATASDRSRGAPGPARGAARRSRSAGPAKSATRGSAASGGFEARSIFSAWGQVPSIDEQHRRRRVGAALRRARPRRRGRGGRRRGDGERAARTAASSSNRDAAAQLASRRARRA